jgi:hypothetical protein
MDRIDFAKQPWQRSSSPSIGRPQSHVRCESWGTRSTSSPIATDCQGDRLRRNHDESRIGAMASLVMPVRVMTSVVVKPASTYRAAAASARWRSWRGSDLRFQISRQRGWKGNMPEVSPLRSSLQSWHLTPRALARAGGASLIPACFLKHSRWTTLPSIRRTRGGERALAQRLQLSMRLFLPGELVAVAVMCWAKGESGRRVVGRSGVVRLERGAYGAAVAVLVYVLALVAGCCEDCCAEAVLCCAVSVAVPACAAFACVAWAAAACAEGAAGQAGPKRHGVTLRVGRGWRCRALAA